MKTYWMVAGAMLSAIAVIFQLVHGVIGINTGFGMTVDLVGVPILLAFFLFGLQGALYTSVVTALAITLIAPESWLGASMKFSATVPMFLIPAYYLLFTGDKVRKIGIAFGLGAFTLLGVFVLSAYTGVYTQSATSNTLLLGLLPIVSIAVFAYALGNVWEKMKPDADWKTLGNWKMAGALMVIGIGARGIAMVLANYYFAGPLFFGMSTEQMLAAIPWQLVFGWNAIQGAIEFSIAWTLAYRFKLAEKYGKW